MKQIKKSLIAIIGAASFMTAMPSHALLVFTGNQVLDMCENRKSESCVLYLEGLVDGIETLDEAQHTMKKQKRLLCIPRGAKTFQLHDVILEFIKTNPDQRHNYAAGLAVLALHKAYRCK